MMLNDNILEIEINSERDLDKVIAFARARVRTVRFRMDPRLARQLVERVDEYSKSRGGKSRVTLTTQDKFNAVGLGLAGAGTGAFIGGLAGGVTGMIVGAAIGTVTGLVISGILLNIHLSERGDTIIVDPVGMEVL